MDLTILDKLLLVFSGVSGFLFGNFDLPLKILLVFIVLDFVTGITKAYRTKTMNSTVCRTGIYQKSAIFIVIIVATMVDLLLELGGATRLMVVYFYLVSEAISVIENVSEGEMGLPVPSGLLEALEKIRKK